PRLVVRGLRLLERDDREPPAAGGEAEHVGEDLPPAQGLGEPVVREVEDPHGERGAPRAHHRIAPARVAASITDSRAAAPRTWRGSIGLKSNAPRFCQA